MATTPNMQMAKPVPLSDSNLAGANEVNAALDVIDAHNHTSGRGLQVPTLGLLINAALPMNGFGLTNLGPSQLTVQSGTLTGAPNAFKLYTFGQDLYFTDGAGQTIQMTLGHNVNVSAAGAWQGLAAPAAAIWTGSEFQLQANTTGPIWGTVDHGDLILRRSGATNPNGLTLRSPASLALAYTLTLPPGTPGANLSALVSDTSGTLTFSTLADGVTLQNTGTVLQILAGGVGTNQLATGAVTNAKIAASAVSGAAGSGQVAAGSLSTNDLANGAVTQVKQGSVTTGFGNIVGTSASTFTQIASMSISLLGSASGRPVAIGCQADSSASVASWSIGGPGGGGTVSISMRIKVNGSVARAIAFNVPNDGNVYTIPTWTNIQVLGLTTSGNNTITLEVALTGSATLTVSHMQLEAYQL